MRRFEGLLAVVVMMGCSSSEPSESSEPVAPGNDAGTESSIEAAAETGADASQEASQEQDAAESGPIEAAPEDAPMEAQDGPQDASGDEDAQTPVDAPEEAAAPGACQPPGPSGNVADCSSLCSTYCTPACSGLPGGAGTCDPYLTCSVSNPVSLSAPIERAFVLPAETAQHQGLDGTGVTCSKTCAKQTSFAFSVGIGHCAKLTSSGGRSFLQEGADCSAASSCAIVQGSQAGTVVRVLASSGEPAAWVYAQVDESWTGHPCPYSCP